MYILQLYTFCDMIIIISNRHNKALLEEIIKQIGNVSKVEIKRVAPKECEEIKSLVLKSTPDDFYEKMVPGYLTSICPECMHSDAFHLQRNDLEIISVLNLKWGKIIAW